MKRKKITASLGSVRLALWLLAAIIIASFAGAVVKKELQPAIFYSWWFFLLLLAFSLNLGVCLSSRIAACLKKPGSLLTHVSILVILAGSLVSFAFSRRGSLELTPGVSSSTFSEGAGEGQLGFSVALEDFHIDWYHPNGEYAITATVADRKAFDSFKAAEGKDYQVGDTGYSFRVLAFYPDFALEEQGPVNRSQEMVNPAVLLNVAGPQGEEERWVFAFHPEMSYGDDPNISFTFRLTPREFTSRVTFSDGKSQMARDIKVNHPASFKGFSFYQASYDETMEDPGLTVLEVVRDPGTSTVFTGFVLLNLGVVLFYARKLGAPKEKEC